MIPKTHCSISRVHLVRVLTLRQVQGRLLLIAFLLLAVPRTLSAHGAGLEADIRYRPAPPVAGEPLFFEVSLSYADDDEPLQVGSVSIGAEGSGGATVPAVELAPDSVEGRWTGQVTLPTGGVWTLEVRVELPGGMARDRYNVQVAPAGTAPGNESGHFVLELGLVPTAAAGQPLWLRYWPLIVAALIVVGLVLVFLFLPAAHPRDREHST